MSESEDLKASAERMRQKEKVEAISKYLDTLIDHVEVAFKKERDAFIIYMIVWAAWVVVGFFNRTASDLFEMFFIIALIYSSTRTAIRAKVHGEFKGCVKTLKILGMIPPLESPGDTENKKAVWSEGLDIVKGWMKKKEKAQDEAYAPA